MLADLFIRQILLKNTQKAENSQAINFGSKTFYQIQFKQLKTNKFQILHTLLIFHMHTTPKKSANSLIESPFVDCVSECRSSMRKLRKKIYKHIKYNPDYHKAHNETASLVNTLKSRSIPQKLLQIIASGSSVSISLFNDMQIENILPFSQIKKCADRQENQTNQILQERKNLLNIEKESKLFQSQYKNSRTAKKMRPLNMQIQNEESELINRSQITPFEAQQLFQNQYQEFKDNNQGILSEKFDNSLMQICSNIFEESNMYRFR